MRVFTASPLQLLTSLSGLINHLEQIEATVFPPFEILQVDGDAAHLAQLIVMTKGKPEGPSLIHQQLNWAKSALRAIDAWVRTHVMMSLS